ncbi:MAG: type IV pilus assembly protein PilM [Planctomycetota bacterium]
MLHRIHSCIDTLKGRRKVWLVNMKSKLKRLLGLPQYDVLGLDIGSSSVRMVQLVRDKDGYTIVAAGVSDIEPVNGDSAAKEANAVKAVGKCLASSKATTRLAVCSVSGPEIAVRNFKFPPLQSEELEGAVRLEASQVCPFNVYDGIVDYEIQKKGESQDGVYGYLVAATNQVVQRKTRIAEKASLSCVLMDVDGLALLNCLSQSKKDPEQVSASAILDVGASCTMLAVMGENNLPFVRTVPYAGKDIVEQIASENNISPEIVMKEIYGSVQTTIPQENLQSSMEKACQKLVSDVAETLRYHSAQAKSSSVEQILVCGGFGMVRGFVDILNRQLPVKAILWNPFDIMRCTVGRQCLDVIQTHGPAMAVAAGLAMRSV